jgi:hypothetical protein
MLFCPSIYIERLYASLDAMAIDSVTKLAPIWPHSNILNLTSHVVKAEQSCFAYGALSDIWMGQCSHGNRIVSI